MRSRNVTFFGVNCVGKTTVATAIVDDLGSMGHTVNVADEMIAELGLQSRGELAALPESVKAEARCNAIRRGLTARADTVSILDMHMMIIDPSTEDGYRSVWPQELSAMVDVPILLISDERDISNRRYRRWKERNGKLDGRHMGFGSKNVLLEQMLERRLFLESFGDRGRIVSNRQGQIISTLGVVREELGISSPRCEGWQSSFMSGQPELAYVYSHARR